MTRTQIATIIQDKVNGAGSLIGVYNYEQGAADSYPYATVTLSEGKARFGDSAGSQSGRNIEENSYVVRVYQEREDALFGAEKAERIAMKVLDELLTAFHMDTTLSGSVKWAMPSTWTLGYDVIDKVVRTLELTIDTMTVVDSK